MLRTLTSPRGMVTAPHHLAAQTGAAVLRDGGNAVEAMVAAAATIAVVYPHMNSIGGDGFWLISQPAKPPVGIDACGRAAGLATPDWYRNRGSRGDSDTRTAGGEHGGRRGLRMEGSAGGERRTTPADPLARGRDLVCARRAPSPPSQVNYTTKFWTNSRRNPGLRRRILHDMASRRLH